jgi:hypothetical protein
MDIAEYIKKQKQFGMTDDEITKALIDTGWKERDIKDAFDAAKGPEEQAVYADAGNIEKKEIPRARVILNEAIHALKQRFSTFFLLGLFPGLTWLSGGIINQLLFGECAVSAEKCADNTTALYANITEMAGFMIGLFIYCWFHTALLIALSPGNEKNHLSELLSLALKKTHLMLVLFFLYGLALVVGFFLLIIPFLIFFVWFLFADIIFIHEKTGIIEALNKSRAYTKGSVWVILVKMGYIELIIVSIAILFGLIGIAIPPATYLFSVLWYPINFSITTIYRKHLYSYIQSSKQL